MRLLNVKTLQLELFTDEERLPPYTILSHCWSKEEVTFQDIESRSYEHLLGYKKLAACCRRSLLELYDYTWIDTCCIDKSSSAELSEAINSMFRWYERASVCYAYLEDVAWDWDEQQDSAAVDADRYQSDDQHGNFRALRRSRWFRRGWTLQELIAPRLLVFFDSRWNEIGSKTALAPLLADITGVDTEVLEFRGAAEGNTVQLQLRTYPVAVRMSWAATRFTTRVEDEAYCLMGIFDVNMPLIYGEGKKAFFRLQQEIIREAPDASILLWEDGVEPTRPREYQGVLAPSPNSFYSCRDIRLPLNDGAAFPPVSAGPVLPITAHLQTATISSTIFLRGRCFPLFSLFRSGVSWDFGPDKQLSTRRLREISTQPGMRSVVRFLYSSDTVRNSPETLDPGDMKYYLAILSATREGGLVGILLEQLPSGIYVRAPDLMSIFRFPDDFAKHREELLDVSTAVNSLTLMLKTKETAVTQPLLLGRRLTLVASLPASYEAPQARWGRHSNYGREGQGGGEGHFGSMNPAYFALFRSKSPDTLPSFALVYVSPTREVGCMVVPKNSAAFAQDGALESLGRLLPAATKMQVRPESMRISLVAQTYDLIVSLRPRPYPEGIQVIIELVPLPNMPLPWSSEKTKVSVYHENKDAACMTT